MSERPGRKSSLIDPTSPGRDLAGNIHRANYSRLARPRCIIVGRETSVIYHKLCELLAEKLDGKLTRNAVIVLLNYSCRGTIARRGRSALPLPRFRAMFNAPVSLTNLSERVASIRAAHAYNVRRRLDRLRNCCCAIKRGRGGAHTRTFEPVTRVGGDKPGLSEDIREADSR